LSDSQTFELSLRAVTGHDVTEFFTQRQARGEARPEEQAQFIARWQRQLVNPRVTLRTISAAGQVVGYIAHFTRKDLPEVSYELGPQYWGQGFATAALRLFLEELKIRPLYARAAKQNVSSIRVLQKNGFAQMGEDRFVAAGGEEIEEFVFVLH
jgi:RimJ/RimL family protein N-acetyltransferase